MIHTHVQEWANQLEGISNDGPIVWETHPVHVTGGI